MLDAALYSCAAFVAPVTIDAIIHVESRGNPLAINVNRGPKVRAASAQQAAEVARYYIAQGYSVDLGLMQVNSRNLAKLGYSVEQMFEPCTNIRAGALILSANYAGASRIHGEGQGALLAALSAYNTGNYRRGFQNGYVARYFGYVPSPSQRALARVAPPPPADIIIFSRREASNATR